MTKEQMVEMLVSVGVSVLSQPEVLGEYNRHIDFVINDKPYRIVWFVNQSTLHMGSDESAPSIPFKFLYLDECYPFGGGFKNGIGFSDVRLDQASFLDRKYPFAVLRIPLDKTGE